MIKNVKRKPLLVTTFIVGAPVWMFECVHNHFLVGILFLSVLTIWNLPWPSVMTTNAIDATEINKLTMRFVIMIYVPLTEKFAVAGFFRPLTFCEHLRLTCTQTGHCQLATPPHPQPSGIHGLVMPSRTTPCSPADWDRWDIPSRKIPVLLATRSHLPVLFLIQIIAISTQHVSLII